MNRGGVAPWLALAAVLQAREAGAQATLPAASEAQVLEVARALFREGVEAFQRQDWATARERFGRALALRPSPLVRFNLALANHNAGLYVDAIAGYREFLREATDAANTQRRAAAQEELRELEGRLAHLTVEAEGDTARAFVLDGHALPLELLGTAIPVDPGSHTVQVEGAGGDLQRAEGTVFERDRLAVRVVLSPRPARDPLETQGAQSRPQAFGRVGIARASRTGRWVDDVLRDDPTPRLWEQHRWTFAAQLGLGTGSGLLGVSARYFPQPWFGLELAGGALGTQGPGLLLAGHLRFAFAPPSRTALGLFVGPSVTATSLDLVCMSSADECPGGMRVKPTVVGAWLNVGAAGEWRFAARWSLRAVLGARLLLNAADFRAAAESAYRCEDNGQTGTFTLDPCALRAGGASGSGGARLQPFLGLDLGFSL
jgi:hypothetical protein